VTPAPPLESFADDLYDALAPVAWKDGETGWHLALYCGAIGAMFQAVADVARDTPDGPGWSAVVDLDRAPDAWLPWLAQLSGATIPVGLTPAESRAWIAGTDGFKRGTPAAIRAAAQSTLSGSGYVAFRERDGDDAYALEVVTLTGETPNPDATLAAIIAQKPGGIVLRFRTAEGQDWQAVRGSGRTWRVVRTDYSSWADLRESVEA